MQRANRFFMFLVVIGGLSCGCAGLRHAPERGMSDLENWLEGSAKGALIQQLQTNSYLRGKPLIIVEAKGEIVQNRIDALSEALRDELMSEMLKHPSINLVPRHPVEPIKRNYALEDRACGGYTDPEILLMIDITPLGSSKDLTARIHIRARTVPKGAWVRGLSLSKSVRLTPRQSRQLHALKRPDADLKGLKFAPFEANENDRMAAYVAGNLTCRFREGNPEERPMKIRIAHECGTFMRLLEKELSRSHPLTLTRNTDQADWVISAEWIPIGAAGPGLTLYQVWVGAESRKGDLSQLLNTYTYWVSPSRIGEELAGKWEIFESDALWGYLLINPYAGTYLGDLWDKNGNVVKRGLIIDHKSRHITFGYLDRTERTAHKIEGILIPGEGIRAQKSSFPDQQQHHWFMRRTACQGG